MRTVATLLALASASLAATTPLFGTSEAVGLISINAKTGTQTAIGNPVPEEGQAQDLSAMDNTRGIFYIVGYNFTTGASNLVGINVTSGGLVYDTPLPFAESGFVGVGQQITVDETTGHVFAGGRLTQTGPHTVGRLDPATGKFSVIASLNATYLPVLGGPCVYDPATSQLILQLGTADAIANFAVNVNTGAVVQIPMDYDTGRVLTTFAYDTVTKLVFGLGVKANGTGIERTLVSLNPTTKTYTTVGVVTDFLVESGGISALDEGARVLTWIGQKVNAKATDPFYLISTDLKTAKTTYSANLCPNDAACPWNLEYRNAV